MKPLYTGECEGTYVKMLVHAEQRQLQSLATQLSFWIEVEATQASTML